MKFINRNLPYIATACLTLVIGMSATVVFGQNAAAGKHPKGEFCSNSNWSSDERVSANDLREVIVASTGSVNVDAGKNGGVSVKGEDRSDVLIRACVQAWGKTEEAARSALAGIRLNTGGTIRAESSGDDNWSVSYQILVPRSTDVNLTAHNGGISVSGVSGTSEFQTTNGGINVSDVSGTVKGRTTNGGVNVSLTGTTWKGTGLDLVTTNGGINLTLPENYAANIETGTVNGGLKSDIPALAVTTENILGDWSSRQRTKRIATSINGGGAPIRVITTNGGVKISIKD